MTVRFGTSTISDSTGNLLFYTDGQKVYNRTGNQMPNGFGLLGSTISTQNCLIVPYPENNKKYYVFTVGTANSITHVPTGLHYSIINMDLDGGYGDVEPFYKNIPLPKSDSATYKITSVRHENNRDVWVIVRNLSNPQNKYHSYLITPAGVSTIPVSSPCITYLHADAPQEGQMKISPDGKLIFCPLYAVPGNEIGSFNTLTGEISLYFTFFSFTGASTIHGAEFSSDCKYIYITTFNEGINNRLLQYDVSLLPKKDSFVASMTIIAEPAGNARDLQAAPDGKIYVARERKNYLGVINEPLLQGNACNYDSLGVYLGGKLCYNGLPQFIQTYFLRFEYKGKCAGESFTFTPNFNPVPDSIHWDFGDPGSGSNNTSTELNPQHV